MKFISITFRQIWAIALKELELDTRYILPFISQVFFSPVKTVIWFFVVYFGFFASGSSHLGSVTKDNYILFLLVGTIFNTFFNIATLDFPSKFFNEKFWQTIQGILIAPINTFKFVFGLSLAEVIKASFAVLTISVIGLAIFPIPIVKFLLIVGIILAVFVGLMFIGLIRAAFILINENANTVFEYLFLALGFISCFYYPIDAFPKFLQPVVYYNPVYQAINLVRNIWLGNNISLFEIYWTAGAILVAIAIGMFLFNYLLKHNDVEGY